MRAKILLIEDDPSTGPALQKVLRAEGYEVDLFTRGDDGLAQARQLACDLVITDFKLPGLSGLELISQIRLIYDNYGYDTEVLAASIRHTMHLIQCAEIGADVVTCPLKVITDLLNHPLTDIGLAKFLADHKKANG